MHQGRIETVKNSICVDVGMSSRHLTLLEAGKCRCEMRTQVTAAYRLLVRWTHLAHAAAALPKRRGTMSVHGTPCSMCEG
jgi:N-methylhydantoinase A/oxoprolinase/acetone carboxylase beta subunit